MVETGHDKLINTDHHGDHATNEHGGKPPRILLLFVGRYRTRVAARRCICVSCLSTFDTVTVLLALGYYIKNILTLRKPFLILLSTFSSFPSPNNMSVCVPFAICYYSLFALYTFFLSWRLKTATCSHNKVDRHRTRTKKLCAPSVQELLLFVIILAFICRTTRKGLSEKGLAPWIIFHGSVYRVAD